MIEQIASPTTLAIGSQQSSNSWEQVCEEIISIVGNFQTLWPVFVFIAALAISSIAPRWMNKLTRNTLDNLKQSGKYIHDIYVEPYGIAETLRYFLFGVCKKRQLIRRYSSLFIGPYRDILKKYGHRVCFSRFTPWSKIEVELQRETDWFRHSEEDHSRQLRTTEESRDFEIFDFHYKYFREALDGILEDAKLVRTKYCHLTGGAGCGKTNLMCRMAEAALAKGYPCILVCASSIKGDVSQAISNALNLPAFMSNHVEIVFFITNLLCWLRRKKMIIMIDAINENDSESFAATINEFVKHVIKYRSVKLLFSCREEYYEQRTSRYEKQPSVPNPYVYRPDYIVKQKDASEILIPAYRKYFAFDGQLSDYVEYRLRTNMLLLRVFFEAFRGSSEHVVSIDKYQVFKKYISLIAKDESRLINVIEVFAAKMVEQNRYDRIRLDAFSLQEQEILKKIATGGGVLFVTDLIDNPQSIVEQKYECISFVYDELRDYCLARYLLMNRSAELPNILEKMKLTIATPLEGIVKYCYEHYKAQRQFTAAQQLLCTYGSEQSQKEDIHYQPHSIGFSMIFESGIACMDYEISYIIHNIQLTLRMSNELDLIDFLTDEKRNPDIANRFVNQILESKKLQQIVEFAEYFLDSYNSMKDPWYSSIAEAIRLRHHVWKADCAYPLGYARLYACIRILWAKRDELQRISKELCNGTIRDLLKQLQIEEGILPEVMSCIMSKTYADVVQDSMLRFFWDEKHGCMLKREDYHDPAYSFIDRFYYSKHRIFALPLQIRLGVIPNTYMGSRIKLLFKEFTWHSFNMYSEYLKYYRKEMPDYCEYLKQKHYFTETEYETWLNRSWRCKVFEDGLGHCAQGLLSNETILEMVQQHLGGKI